MRTACVLVPGAAIQAAVRGAPHLAGKPLALVASARVVAVSRAAHAAGVVIGQPVSAARARVGDLEVAPYDRAAVAAELSGLADVLGATSPRVRVDETRGAVFVQLPPGARGTSFGEHALEHATRLGLLARVGVADDWFTAWAAAQAEPRLSVRVVPTGGSASFLSPLAIDYLPLDADLRDTLRLLGVRRLGEFAALPPPSVGRRWSAGTLDLQELARGGARAEVEASPRQPVRESLDLLPAVAEVEALSFVLLPLVDRVCARLEGRGRVATELRVTLVAGANDTVVQVAVDTGSTKARTWIDLVRARLGGQVLAHPVDRLRVEVVSEAAPVAEDAEDLFAHVQRSSRVERPRAARVVKRPASEPRAAEGDLFARAAAPGLCVVPTPEPGAIRVVDPPAPLATQGGRDGGAPEQVIVDEEAHRVVAALGPTRLEAAWMSGGPVARDYWELTLDDGRRLWVFRDRAAGGVFLAGVMR